VESQSGASSGDREARSSAPGESERILLLVDGHAFAYRAFHAIQHLASPEGAPTNAIFGFIKMLAKMRARVKPTHLAVAWDGGLAAERLTALPEYKAQRPPMPTDLARQLDGINDYLKAARVGWWCQDGVDADDVIATLTAQAVREGVRVVIASPDKDFMQLVSAQVGLLNPSDKSEAIWGAREVREKSGVDPDQIVDWLSLMGDAVDNIPGVGGIGPRTAADLLMQFGSIASLYARLGEVKSNGLRQRLSEARESVFRNRELVRLKDDVPGWQGLLSLAVQSGDELELRRLYQAWGFTSLLKELDRGQPRQAELF
jgi:DNA polymerase I